MQRVKWILFAIVLLLLLIVVFQNLEETQVDLLFATLTLPKAALLTITLLIGFVLGLVARTLWQVQAWRKRSKAKKSTTRTEAEDSLV